jgi:hypothetical protein
MKLEQLRTNADTRHQRGYIVQVKAVYIIISVVEHNGRWSRWDDGGDGGFVVHIGGEYKAKGTLDCFPYRIAAGRLWRGHRYSDYTCCRR